MATAPASTTQPAPEKGRPHPIRVVNALNTHWRHEITPVDGEPAKIGHHAVNYLIAILSWADDNFLIDGLYGGGCLCLANSRQERLTGFSVRQCMRIRQALHRHGLIHVVPGKAGRGSKTSPRITVRFSNILDVRDQSRDENVPEVGNESRSIAPERRDTHQRIAPDRRHIPTDPPVRTGPRSFGGMRPSTTLPKIDRPNSESNPESRSGPEPIDPTPAPKSPSQRSCTPPSITAEDLQLVSAVVGLWQESPKCPPARRRRLEEAVRSEGDAQTVRLLASLRREGMPEELLVKAFQACLDAYTPDVDKLHSPFIHSLVWFQPWIENAADPWRRERSSHRVLADQTRRREAERQEEESSLAPPPLTSLEAFLERYSGRSILPPADVLCGDLDGFAPDVASCHRDQGSSKREILDDVKRRCET